MVLPPKIRNPWVMGLYTFYSLIFISIVTFRYYYLAGDAADSALFENIAILGSPPGYESEFLKSIQVIIRKFVSTPTEVSILNFPTDIGLDGLLIGAHAYLIMPLISVFSKILGYKFIVAFVAASITIMPFAFALGIIARSAEKFDFKTHASVIAIIGTYPAILWSGLGQFYPDRLFVIFFPVFLMLINTLKHSDKKRDITFFLILAMLSMSVTERSSLYVFLACAIFAVTSGKHRNVLIITGIISLVWSITYYKYISTDKYPNSFFDQAKSIDGLKMLIFTIPTLKLVLFHIPGFILLAKMRDLQVLLLLAMAPNLLGNIGGAEKIGWVTHYMSYLSATYIGVILVWLQRKLELDKSIEKSSKHKSKVRLSKPVMDRTTIVAITLATTCFIWVEPNSAGSTFSTNYQDQTGIFGKTLQWIEQGSSKKEFASYKATSKLLNAAIPANAKIGVSEGSAKYLSSKQPNIYMFPAGIEKLDYVVLISVINLEKSYVQNSIANYSNPEVGVRITDEAQAMLLGPCFKDVSPAGIYPIFMFKREWNSQLNGKCLKIG
jgi:hypothetical protein